MGSSALGCWTPCRTSTWSSVFAACFLLVRDTTDIVPLSRVSCPFTTMCHGVQALVLLQT